MNYSLFSITSSRLKNDQKRSICLLKNQQWKFGMKSQIDWFRKNVKKDDIHNLFYIKSKLVGYTLLRKRTCKINYSKKNVNYLFFDTLIIDRKYQKKKLSNLFMNFNNTVIEQSGHFSSLICKKEFLEFYKKNMWLRLQKKNVEFKDHFFSTNAMIFNLKNINKKKFTFYINK